MKLTTRFFVMLFLGSLLYTTCTDPTTLGADLFEEDLASIAYTDTLTLRVSTELGDSSLTYSSTAFSQLSTYLFGQMIDPIFGKSTASIYLQPRLDVIEPDFTQAIADSLILVVPYDTSHFYGNTNQTFEMEVFQLDEPFSEDIDYYSNQHLLTKAIPLGSAAFHPVIDSLTIATYSSDGTMNTVVTAPQLRLQLPLSFGQELLDQPALTFSSDTAFLNFFPGLYLKPTLETDGLISFILNSNNAGMYLYYKDATGVQRQFYFEIGPSSIYFERFEHDYTGSIVESLLNDEVTGNEVSFVQGMTGVRTKIEIPYIENLKGRSINKAEMEVTIKTLDEDITGVFDPLDEIILLYKEDDGFRLVSDLGIAEDPTRPLTKQKSFGGVLLPQENGQPAIYQMNISTHLQEMINGEKPNVLYIAAYRRTENGGRVSIYGPNDPLYGLKIRIAFTE